MAFHAVNVPWLEVDEDLEDLGVQNYIFKSREEAFGKMRLMKDSRVNSFNTYDEARNFVLHGIEKPWGETASPSIAVQTPEKSLYRGPKSQDLVLFRKLIEQDKVDLVSATIWTNPRYLIGAGDTPTILKESFRYNALHVAALSKSGKMCEYILHAIANPQFIGLLHERSTDVCNEVSGILLDLYLNMPEKGRNETPLHLAAKFGALDVVEVLTSYPECAATRNSDGFYAKDIICSRVDNKNPELVKQIEDMLTERFYVPVIRSVDNSIPPIIGEPFSSKNPPNLCRDPLSPEMEIQAFAGPMNKEQAHTFRRRWKTPPRISSPKKHTFITSPGSPKFGGSSPLQLSRYTPNNSASTPNPIDRRGARQLFPVKATHQLFPSPNDEDRSITFEEAMNNLTFENDYNDPIAPAEKLSPPTVPTTPAKGFTLPTPFKLYRDRNLQRLRDNVDDSFNSSAGSDNSTLFDSPMYRERHTKLSDTEKGLELVGRELAKEQNIKWREHWPFLDEFCDIGCTDGLQKLEQYFKRCADKNDTTEQSSIANLCENLEKCYVKDRARASERVSMQASATKMLHPTAVSPGVTPFSAYLCAEKSWQVYAQRMAKMIVLHLDSVAQINDTLRAELKRLQSLICSYKEDLLFWAVNFQAAHSRFAHLIVYYVSQEHNGDLSEISDIMTQIQQSTQKHVIAGDIQAEFVSANLQLQCLLNCILKYLKDSESKQCPDVLTTEQDSAAIWKSEHKCNCAWLLEKQESRIKRISRRHKGYDRMAITSSQVIFSDAVNDWQSSVLSTSSSDDEEFLSDSGSEDDVYFTPPESVSQCGTPERKDYKLYVLGDVPTKTDVDVLNALAGTDIDRTIYPYIFQWKIAMLRHPIEEWKNFPVPTAINPGAKHRSADPHSKLFKSFPIKCVFSTPRKLPPSPVKKQTNILRPSALQMNHTKIKQKTTIEPAVEDVIVAQSPLFYCPVIRNDSAKTGEPPYEETVTKPLTLNGDVSSVSVTVISSGGQHLILRTDQDANDAGLVSNVFVHPKDPPDTLGNGLQDDNECC